MQLPSMSALRRLHIVLMVWGVYPCVQAAGFAAKFADVPTGASTGAPVVIQLAVATNRIAYRAPAAIYARFANLSQEAVELPLDDGVSGGLDFRMRRSTGWKAGLRSSCAILMPGETLTVKLHDLLLSPGTNSLRFTYMLAEPGAHAGLIDPRVGQEIRSDALELIVVDAPLGDRDKEALDSECAELAALMGSSELDEAFVAAVRRRLIVSSPYSVPHLTNLLLTARSPTVRARVAETLCSIADQESADEFRFHRDTSAADSILTQLEREGDPHAKAELCAAICRFSDALDSRQEQRLSIALSQALGHADMDVRFAAALACLRVFPAMRKTIRDLAATPSFAGESGRAVLVNIIEKLDEKNRGGGGGDGPLATP